MNLWMVRAGSHGEQEGICLEKKVVTIGWNDLPDLRNFKSKHQLKEVYLGHYSEKSAVAIGLKVGQIWRFATQIEKGDLVVLPSKFAPEIHIGIVEGPYQYGKTGDDVYHTIPVSWKKTLSRSDFDEDLLYSFGSLLTVSCISRNNAAERVNALLQGKAGENTTTQKEDEEWPAFDGEASLAFVNTDDIAYTKIEKFLQRHFKTYDFEDLIREILKAHGYNTTRTKEIGYLNNTKTKGADGGVDILASKGALGFEEPNICVQIKSGEGKLPPKELRELVGVMATFKANFGLLVSWGGFSDELIREAREKYFRIRLWNSGHVIQEIFEHYDKFSTEFKVRLPLKRIWVLEEEREK